MPLEGEAQAFREVPVEEIPLGDLHIFPIPPEFDLLPGTESLEIPLTGGQAVVVNEDARPNLGDADALGKIMGHARAVGDAKAVYDAANSDLEAAKAVFLQDVVEYYGLRGGDFPDTGQGVHANLKRDSEVTNPDGFKGDLGLRFPLVGIDQLDLSLPVLEGLRDKEGNLITVETYLEILREGLDARGVSEENQARIIAAKRRIIIKDRDDLAREIRAGNVGISNLQLKPRPTREVRVDALERSQGSRPARKASSKKK